MTTIAWDGRYLAADTRGVFGNDGICMVPCHKLMVADNQAFATTGRITEKWMSALVYWWLNGADPSCLPPHGLQDNYPGNFIVACFGVGALSMSYGTPWPQSMGNPVGWGTGSDYATGAMEMGATAMRSVEVAMKHDSATGGDIEFVDVECIGKGVQHWGTI